MPEPMGQVPGQTPAPVQVPAPSVEPQVAPITNIEPGTSDRTREQFEKLLQSNQRLYESNEALRQEIASKRDAQQTFAPTQTTPAPTQPAPIDSDIYFTDPATGMKYVDETKLADRMNEIKRQASKAEEVVQSYIKTSENREIERQNKETFSAYPELNPAATDKFDKEFSRQVRSVLIDSMYNADEYGGRVLSFKEAADFVKSKNPQASVQPAVDAAAQAAAEAGRAAKEAGSAQIASQPVQVRPANSDDADIRALQEKTRRGDDRALAERLKYTEHINPRA